jgi:hypothetical protein
MKLFLAYRYSGEDLLILDNTLSLIIQILKSRGYDVFCSFFEQEFFKKMSYSVDEIYDYCNQKLAEHDLIIFFIKSAEKSHGMDMELEKAKLFNKKIVVIIQKDLDFNDFRASAQKIIEYDNLSEMETLIKGIEEL